MNTTIDSGRMIDVKPYLISSSREQDVFYHRILKKLNLTIQIIFNEKQLQKKHLT